jgi:hypothetical protein
MMRISFRCDERLFEAVDKARGRIPRETFVRDLVRAAVAPEPVPFHVEPPANHWDDGTVNHAASAEWNGPGGQAGFAADPDRTWGDPA